MLPKIKDVLKNSVRKVRFSQRKSEREGRKLSVIEESVEIREQQRARKVRNENVPTVKERYPFYCVKKKGFQQDFILVRY